MIWVSETVPAQCSLSAGTPRHCLPLAETLKSWIGVAAGRGFLSFITGRGDWKKKKKRQSDSQKCQVKHMCIGFERRWSPTPPGDTHPCGRRAAWLNALLSDFLHHEDKWSPVLFSSSFFLQEASAGVDFKTSVFRPVECGARSLSKCVFTTLTVYICSLKHLCAN